MSHHHDWHQHKIDMHKMRSERLHRHPWDRPHHGPNPMFRMVLFFLFMGLLFGGFGGWWVWFFIFPVFIWGGRRASCWINTYDDSDIDDNFKAKRKNDEKLKNDELDDSERRYVRTADGEYLEIV